MSDIDHVLPFTLFIKWIWIYATRFFFSDVQYSQPLQWFCDPEKISGWIFADAKMNQLQSIWSKIGQHLLFSKSYHWLTVSCKALQLCNIIIKTAIQNSDSKSLLGQKFTTHNLRIFHIKGIAMFTFQSNIRNALNDDRIVVFAWKIFLNNWKGLDNLAYTEQTQCRDYYRGQIDLMRAVMGRHSAAPRWEWPVLHPWVRPFLTALFLHPLAASSIKHTPPFASYHSNIEPCQYEHRASSADYGKRCRVCSADNCKITQLVLYKIFISWRGECWWKEGYCWACTLP